MLTVARALAWLFVAANLLLTVALLFTREGGDAATRGIGRGLATLVGGLGLIAAVVLAWESRSTGHVLAVVLGGLLALVPAVLPLLLVMPRGLALLYPSMRRMTPTGPVVRYAFPDDVTRDTAIALVMQDYARVAELLGTGKPSLTARDERGTTLLAIAIYGALTVGGSTEGLRLVLAAGAKPHPDPLHPDSGAPTVFTDLATSSSPHAFDALSMLMAVGLAPEFTTPDGRSTLYLDRLQPKVARLLLERGIDRAARCLDPERADWSAVTHQVNERNWETARILLEAGVPRDFATPPGSRLTEVLEGIEGGLSAPDLANPALLALRAALANGAAAKPR
jgi:hypothetical protein